MYSSTMASFFTLIATLCVMLCGAFAFAQDGKVYIVYMGAALKDTDGYLPSAHHESILQEVLENSLPSESLVHSYGKSFNGFATKLTDTELQKLAGMDGIVSVFPSKTYNLQTTRSWDFMGVSELVNRLLKVESDIIVGLLDSGIWPESKSFSDEGFGPPPKKWKGACEGGKNFTCNNKIIGARFYKPIDIEELPSTRDTEGHGTHTSSTVAGNEVKNASFYGIREGTARGAVPSARIAMYKVCWTDGCKSEDILAAFDDAINDGVDILSVSLGGDVTGYSDDPIAIGAFHALQKGILTSQSAGNSGPGITSVASVAPWIFTVAASSIDRRIISKVVLGDGTTLEGVAVNGFDLKGKKFPLIYARDAVSSYCASFESEFCSSSCLNSTLVKGKIVYCDSLVEIDEPFNSKAIGAIYKSTDRFDTPYTYPLPASGLNATDSKRVLAYINSTRHAVATILMSAVVNDSSAPVVASFSSRGPNPIEPGILKPDVTAPGIDIIAAWSPVARLVDDAPSDTRSVKYHIISGTSMACPHVTGAAAYIKSFHPDWSPSAIKSALMTTAFPLNASTNPWGEFGYGAGHIDPLKAVNPGLVYETSEVDYIKFLCSSGYSSGNIKTITGNSTISCDKISGSVKDLNYPSIATTDTVANFTRTVTNVGIANSSYTATIISPQSVNVVVTPKVLSFKSLNEKKSFVVKVSTKVKSFDVALSASLVWSDGIHHVRSPIVLYKIL